jgi:hypothetical protein
MIAELYQFKTLPQKYKDVLKREFPEDKTIYVIKDVDGTPKSITTSVTECIKKVQTK